MIVLEKLEASEDSQKFLLKKKAYLNEFTNKDSDKYPKQKRRVNLS